MLEAYPILLCLSLVSRIASNAFCIHGVTPTVSCNGIMLFFDSTWTEMDCSFRAAVMVFFTSHLARGILSVHDRIRLHRTCNMARLANVSSYLSTRILSFPSEDLLCITVQLRGFVPSVDHSRFPIKHSIRASFRSSSNPAIRTSTCSTQVNAIYGLSAAPIAHRPHNSETKEMHFVSFHPK